ncbi:hypothetical protein [Pontixanthobacter rizhaonensis]|uniref:hypothetical protein n=1 Tax=Pontixanthobacter rizhaonensis TaxID=2730337 RepID=UPI001FE79CF9|nr:hypothetical protein [Pontixanthobacter rizhaonensis]
MIAETLVAMPDGILGGMYAETLAVPIEETPGATTAGIAAKHGAITAGGTVTNGVKAAGITGTTTAGITATHSALVAIMHRSAATVIAE